MKIKPTMMLLAMLAGWINRQQQEAINYLLEENRILKELLTLSLVGTILGLGVGVLLSRLALGSTGFFQFDTSLLLNEPVLVTIESLLISIIVGILLPILCYFGYNLFFSTKNLTLNPAYSFFFLASIFLPRNNFSTIEA